MTKLVYIFPLRLLCFIMLFYILLHITLYGLCAGVLGPLLNLTVHSTGDMDFPGDQQLHVAM